MTHEQIYEKFMIEYDKDNVTSSYPSLTRKEKATILDKAYLALIAQKVTGNNVRRASLESDIKSVQDLQPLIKTNTISLSSASSDIAENVVKGTLPITYLYFIQANVLYRDNKTAAVQLIKHESAEKFFITEYNKPWIKIPVAFIQDNKIFVIYDKEKHPLGPVNMKYTCITSPNKFVGDTDSTLFELSDSMAEELVSLAITFALENVESQRLNTKLNTRGLEA